MHKVTLLTEWGPIPLDGHPHGLKEWPAFLDGSAAELAWDDHSGQFRETLPGGVQTGELNLVVRGRTVGRDVSYLVDSLRWGEDGFTVQVQSHGAEVRTLQARLKEAGSVAWHPEPHRAVLAEVPLRVEYSGHWVGETTTQEYQGVSGPVVVPYAGDIPVWPRITLTGGATVKLREQDQNLSLPAGEYVVETDPAKRGVFTRSGERVVSQVVPFWPLPPRMVPGGIELIATARGAAKITVECEERWSKAWL